MPSRRSAASIAVLSVLLATCQAPPVAQADDGWNAARSTRHEFSRQSSATAPLPTFAYSAAAPTAAVTRNVPDRSFARPAASAAAQVVTVSATRPASTGLQWKSPAVMGEPRRFEAPRDAARISSVVRSQTSTAADRIASRVPRQPAPTILTTAGSTAASNDPFEDPFGDGGSPAEGMPEWPAAGPELIDTPILRDSEPRRLHAPWGGFEMAQADGSGNLGGDRGDLEPCPGEPIFKPIREVTTDISPPEPASESRDINLPPNCGLGDMPFDPRNFALTTYTWKASGLCYKPLYFEDVALERYGHSWGPLLQPVMSGAHFFATVPLLPYKMGMDPPWECVYPLGHYRPGSCAPYMIPPFPISLRGAAVEAGAVVGGVGIIP